MEKREQEWILILCLLQLWTKHKSLWLLDSSKNCPRITNWIDCKMQCWGVMVNFSSFFVSCTVLYLWLFKSRKLRFCSAAVNLLNRWFTRENVMPIRAVEELLLSVTSHWMNGWHSCPHILQLSTDGNFICFPNLMFLLKVYYIVQLPRHSRCTGGSYSRLIYVQREIRMGKSNETRRTHRTRGRLSL